MYRRTLLLGVALSLAGASASSTAAIENPFFRVSGVPTPLLAIGLAPAKALRPWRFQTARATITCAHLKLTLLFQSGFEDCTAVYAHRPCEVHGRRIATAMLMSALGFASPGRTGKLLTITMPLAADSSRVSRSIEALAPALAGESNRGPFTMQPIAHVRLGGLRCPVKETTLEGFFVAENLVNGKIVSSKKNEVEVPGIVESMMTKPVSTVYIEESGTIAPVRVGLRMFGESATVSGSLETTLKTGQEWGIFTVGRAENESGCESWTKLMINLEKFC